ncbi:MAG: hypothetical protein WDM80_05085 [Limisphaerales bacterium]
MIFHADVPQPTEPAEASTPVTISAAAPRLRVSGLHHAPEAATPAVAELPPPLIPQLDMSAASSVCKFHPRSHARWYCGKCKRSFCDLCVNSHHNQKKCRACGVECAPLELEAATVTEKGFITSLPGAFIYPFRGAGVLVLIFTAILFSVLGAMGGIFGILIKIGAIGYLFSYMQNIIHATAAGETHMPELPGMDDVFGGFLRLAGTVAMSFGLTFCLLVAKFNDVDIPVSVIMITILLGCFYFPMAFLVVAMKDNVLACNPLVVVPSILRVPLPYLVTVILFAGIFGFQQHWQPHLHRGRIGDIFDHGHVHPAHRPRLPHRLEFHQCLSAHSQHAHHGPVVCDPKGKTRLVLIHQLDSFAQVNGFKFLKTGLMPQLFPS